jgi:hypothetical protein
MSARIARPKMAGQAGPRFTAVVAVTVIATFACNGKEASSNTGGDAAEGRDTAIASDSAGVDAADGEPPDFSGREDAYDAADAEYCPSPLFPPRSDGCPCQTPGTAGPAACKTSEIGKVCDYLQDCPSSTGSRYTCEWRYPEDAGPRFPAWVESGFACPGG